MKKLVLILAVLFSIVPIAHGAIARVGSLQSQGVASGNPTVAVTIGAGDSIVASCPSLVNDFPPVITTTSGEFFTVIPNAGGNGNSNIQILKNSTGGTITLLCLARGNSTVLLAQGYSGLDKYDPIDFGKSEGVNHLVTTSFTSRQADELLVSAMVNWSNSTFTATPSSGSMSMLGTVNGGSNSSAMADVIVSSIQTNYTVTWTASASNFPAASIVALRGSLNAPRSKYLQGKVVTSGASADLSAQYDNANASGGFALAACKNKSTTPTISSSNNTWTPVVSVTQGNLSFVVAYAKNIAGVQDTVHCIGPSSAVELAIGEWDGVERNNPFDVSNNSTIAGGQTGPGDLTTLNANDLVINIKQIYSGQTPGGWQANANFFLDAASPATASGIAFGHQVISSAQTISGPSSSKIYLGVDSFDTSAVLAFKLAPYPSSLQNGATFSNGAKIQ